MPKRVPVEALPHEELLTPAQVWWLTKRHEETVTKALRDKELRGHQNGDRGRWLVRREDAIAWAMGQKSAA